MEMRKLAVDAIEGRPVSPVKPPLRYMQKGQYLEPGAQLRHVGNVNSEVSSSRGPIFSNERVPCGWYTTCDGTSYKDGTGLAWGSVFRLPARRRKPRFMVGYEEGGSGYVHMVFKVYEGTMSHSSYDADDDPIIREVAIIADQLAESYSEECREQDYEYQQELEKEANEL